MPATIQIPRDVFVRLRPATDGTPIQGILFGQREETLDRRLVIHVKVCAINGKQIRSHISTTIAHNETLLMNWKGQTVLGWFAAPELDVLSRCNPPRIASVYFRTIQSSMLKVIVANYLRQHAEYDVREITPLIARESCALFQDLIGIVIQKAPKTIDSDNSTIIMDIESTTAQCYFSAPSLSEVLNQFQNLNRDVKGDIVEMNILKELADVLPTGVNGLGISGASTNNHPSLIDEREDEDDEVGELFSVWGNVQGASNKKLRARRASTTDITDGISRRASYSTASEDVVEEATRKRKGIDSENYSRSASKKASLLLSWAKTPASMTTNVIPAPFMIIPGQGSEYLHEALGEDSLYYSTEFDESLMSSFTKSHFAPTNDHQTESPPQSVMTYAQLSIARSLDAISHHVTSCTQGKISMYSKSCQEYELLLEILEALDGVGDEFALSEKLENWIENAEDEDDEVIIRQTSNSRSEEVDTESVGSESQDTNIEVDRQETYAPANATWSKSEIKKEVEVKSEEGEMDEDPSSNNNVGAEVSSSSIEEGEIDEEEEINVITRVTRGENSSKKGDEKSSSPLHNKNARISAFNLEVGKTTNVRENSPGWAWDDEEMGE
ncbi:3573_t:CDS:2 [Acaulospora morrowiae]|uniref:3573_t:CDS:1 n=1 Tax=Acaulospora morrowiae TaxID=94023 RepID=A0A9N9F6N9_9GLOM|nr:3573_t:CDS:2 [Acaulospora morrowiae]